MAETSLHLSNNVFAAATLIRQWVLSIPVPLRYMCARNPQLQGKILRLTNAVIAKSIKSSIPGLGLNHKKLQTGAVTLIQRFGGHVNLNIHFHMLHVQGAWEINDDKTVATFHAASNPTHDELLACINKIAAGTIKILKRMNLVEQGVDGIDVVAENEDNKDPLSNIHAASTQNKIALGLRKGKNIRRLIEQLEEEFRCAEPRMTGDMAASFMGFSLHAGVSVWSSNKARLEQLIRYTARPAVSEERLSQASNGDIIYKLKKPWTDGTTAVIFSPLEFLEKLASLVPLQEFTSHAFTAFWHRTPSSENLSCLKNQRRKSKSRLATKLCPSPIKNKIASPGLNFSREYSRSTWITVNFAAAK
jgi:hypothetical protein